MLNRIVSLVVGFVLGCAALTLYAQSGGGYDLSWSTIDGGGGESSGGGYTLTGTVGQPDAQAPAMTGGSYSLQGGFWPGTLPPCNAFAPVDYDQDCDVDNNDFQFFESCATGPEIPQVDTNCSGALLDGDPDVDGADFAVFQLCLTGPGIVADANCAN